MADKYYLISRASVSIHHSRATALKHAKQLEAVGYLVKVLQSTEIKEGNPTEIFTLIYKT